MHFIKRIIRFHLHVKPLKPLFSFNLKQLLKEPIFGKHFRHEGIYGRHELHSNTHSDCLKLLKKDLI